MARGAQVGVARILAIEFAVQPIFSEEFNRMRRPNRSVPAAQIVGRAVLITTPADSFRMFRV